MPSPCSMKHTDRKGQVLFTSSWFLNILQFKLDYTRSQSKYALVISGVWLFFQAVMTRCSNSKAFAALVTFSTGTAGPGGDGFYVKAKQCSCERGSFCQGCQGRRKGDGTSFHVNGEIPASSGGLWICLAVNSFSDWAEPDIGWLLSLGWHYL